MKIYTETHVSTTDSHPITVSWSIRRLHFVHEIYSLRRHFSSLQFEYFF